MKIGVISDVHADLARLTAALALLDGHGVDEMICAGDLVDGGYDENAVIDTMRRRNIPTVQGNHDLGVIAEQAWLRRQAVTLHRRDDDEPEPDDLITTKHIAWLTALPLMRELEFAGVKVCLAHGTPWSNWHYFFPTSTPLECKRVFNNTSADIVVLGHTHMPMRLQYGDKWIFNAGSVYHNRYPILHTCGILTLPDVAFDVYDIDTGDVIPIPATTVTPPT